MSSSQTLIEAVRQLADPDVCLDIMSRMRWPDGVTCPTCGSKEVRFISTRRIWECKAKHAKRQFSVKVGTIFEDSPISLDKWLIAMWLIANAKNGISSYELAKDLGVTQTTAWFMLQRIRLAMQEEDGGIFGGQVEVDETFIGGRARFMHKDKRAEKITGSGAVGKVAVMGLLQRHGLDSESRVRTKVIPNTRRTSLSPEVRKNVAQGSEVFTDALKSYSDLDKDYIHQVIDHAEEYVRGQIHTNGIENFWSLLKRAIRGTYVSVEPFHLFRYLDEESFRFNTRKTDDGNRFQYGSPGRRREAPDLQGTDWRYDARLGRGEARSMKKDEETPFQRFERLVRQVVSVPKTEIDRREAEWRKHRGKQKPKRQP